MEIPFAHRLALLIAVIAVVLCALVGVRRTVREADTTRYEQLAENLLHRGVISSCKDAPFLPEINRMPGYPVFLAAVKAVAGEGDYKVVFAQSLLHGLTALLLFWLAFALVGNLTFSLLTQLAWALYPYAFYHATTLMSETMTTAALTLALAALVIWLRTRRRVFFVLSCVGFIASAYTRPNLWIIPPFLLFLAVCFKPFRSRLNTRTLAVLCLVIGITLVPWIARNYLTFGKILIGSNNYLGYNLCESSVQFRFTLTEMATFCGTTDELTANWLNECDWRKNLAQDDEFRQRAIRQIREHPVSSFAYALQRPFRIWLSFNLDNRPQTLGVRIVQLLAGTVTLTLFPLFLFGLYLLAKGTGEGWILAAVCVAISATHLIVVAMGRYSMPARPVYVLAVLYTLWVLWSNRKAILQRNWAGMSWPNQETENPG